MPNSSDLGTIRRVCAWCGKDMGRVDSDEPYEYPVTHGMCFECARIISTFRDIPLDQLLRRLDGPVLVIDDAEGRVVAANDEAAAALGGTADDMTGRLGGEVTECVHAGEPGGCGQTVHCSGCTIRNLVMGTAESGEGQEQVPAFQYTVSPGGIRKRRYLLSTEKVGELVLLRIRIQPDGEEGEVAR